MLRSPLWTFKNICVTDLKQTGRKNIYYWHLYFNLFKFQGLWKFGEFERKIKHCFTYSKKIPKWMINTNFPLTNT